MPAVVLVATFHPVPGKTEEVVAAVTAAIPDVHAEEGCELYALHRGRDTLVMIEKWASRDALAAHGRGPALTALGPRLEDLLTGPAEIVRLEPIPAGTEAQGAL